MNTGLLVFWGVPSWVLNFLGLKETFQSVNINITYNFNLICNKYNISAIYLQDVLDGVVYHPVTTHKNYDAMQEFF
jgi:hypothetical protein